ncbi:O-acetyl-ADP-ribose deacetylase [compost metagenome]
MAGLLRSCYQNSLTLAIENGCKTIAFPNISTGIYGYPKAEAAEIAVSTVKAFLDQNDAIETVVFVCFDDENYLLIQEQLENS